MSFMQLIAAAVSALVSITVALLALLRPGSGDDVNTISVAVMYSFLIPYCMAFVAQYVATCCRFSATLCYTMLCFSLEASL